MTVEKRPVGSGWRAGKPRTRRKQRYVVKGVTYTSPLPWYGAAVELRLGEAAEELQMAVGELPVMVVDAVHRELQRLEDSTAKGYATYWAQFERFCDETGLCPLPAASITVRTFLSEDLAFRAKESSMQQYLSAINKAHGHLKLPLPGIGEEVSATRHSIRRDQIAVEREDIRIRVSADVVSDALVLGVNEPHISTDLLRSIVAVSVDGACGSRGGTGVHIRDGDVSVSDDGRIAIVIRSAKGEVETDELTGDERVVVFEPGSVVGLAELIRRFEQRRRYLGLCAGQHNADASGRGSWYRILGEQKTHLWDVAQMNVFLKAVLSVLGVSAPKGFKYTYHSIRHMAASSMAAINVHESKMVDLQGWKSRRVALTTYIDPKCPASRGCYHLFGHLLPPSEAVIRSMRGPVAADVRMW